MERSGAHAAFRRQVTAGPRGLGQFPAENIELLGWLALSDLRPQATSASGVWGYVSPSGREYAIIGLDLGTVFVEVTDPSNPVLRDFVVGPQSIFRDIKTGGSTAYVVSEGGQGIQVIDLSNLDSGSVTLVREVIDGGVPTQTRSVAVDPVSGFLYRFGGGPSGIVGVRAYDLANPNDPSFVGNPWNVRYVHDGQVVTYDDGPYAGRQIAFCCTANTNDGSGAGSGLDVLDAANKSNMVSLARLDYQGAKFSHQLWLSHDRRYVYLSDENVPSTVFVIDVAELGNPVLAATFTNGNTARSHNLFVLDSLVFASNQRSGLRVFSVTEPTRGVQVAFLDTYPADDLPGATGQHSGQWSNYPFLPSGTILCSDTTSGLFAARLALLAFHYPEGRPGMAAANMATPLTVKIGDPGLPPDTGSVVLHYSVLDGPIVQVSMSDAGDNHYYATLPPIGCEGGYIDYFVSADTLEGATFTDPFDAPARMHRAFVLGHDDFELDFGWTVSGNATDGHWDRGVPVNCNRGDPPSDFDGSGSCWLTDNDVGNCNSDVDDGATILTSPPMDMSGGGTISFAYWFNDIPGGAAGAGDKMTVEMSTNLSGTDWTLVRTYDETWPAWRTDTIQVGTEVSASDHLRIRFTVHDANQVGVIEGGLDDFRVERSNCGVPGDADGDGDVDLDDYASFSDCHAGPGAAPIPALGNITPEDCLNIFDFDGDGDVDLADYDPFQTVLAN